MSWNESCTLAGLTVFGAAQEAGANNMLLLLFPFAWTHSNTVQSQHNIPLFSRQQNRFICSGEQGYYFCFGLCTPIVGWICRRALSGHYSQHPLHTTVWDRESGRGVRESMVSCSRFSQCLLSCLSHSQSENMDWREKCCIFSAFLLQIQ